MFTGLISDVGRFEARDGGVFRVSSSYDPATIAIGASIAFDGCCLTATEISPREKGCLLTVDVSNETLSRTTLGDWSIGERINMERSLRAGDELGGHIVSGHVDGVAEIVGAEQEGDSVRFEFDAPDDFASYIAYKGSVALDGVSLTVNLVEGHRFGVNIIHHTQEHTTFGVLKTGDRVNLEVDTIARYVARLLERE